MKFDTHQQYAIDVEDKNVVVSASAGAGKTTLLVERLFRIIMKNNIDIDKIIAMTFTEAAASEMKKRLALRLLQAREENPEKIDLQLSLLQNAQITTIDSFCLSIIKQYYYLIGLKIEMLENVISVQQQTELEQKVLNNLLDNDKYAHLKGKYKNIENIILQFYKQARNYPNPHKQLAIWKNQYHITTLEQLDPHWKQVLLMQMNEYLDLYKTYLMELDIYADEDLKTIIQLKNKCIDEINKEDYVSFQTKVSESIEHVFKKYRKSKNISDIYDAYDVAFTNLIKHEDKFLKTYYPIEVIFADFNKIAPDIDLILTASADFIEDYKVIKQAQNCIDFGDMSYYAIQILESNDYEIAKLYQNTIFEIMVDEFQDTNDIQDYIVNLISNGNNVFRVGDIKQSIYRFRLAKPEIMMNYMQKKDDFVNISLLKNYRSSEYIVKFNNVLFEKIMNLPTLNSSYNQNDIVSIGTENQKQNNNTIVFHELQKGASEDEKVAQVGKYIAAQIQMMVNKQNFNWNDFVILTNSNEDNAQLKRIFDMYNIPCFAETKTSFATSEAVQAVLAFLRILDNPYDNIAWVVVLTSQIYQYQFNDLAQMEKGNYYKILKNDKKLAQIYYLIKNKEQFHFDELFTMIYNINHFYEFRCTNQERASLDVLFEFVVKNKIVNTRSFLKHIGDFNALELEDGVPNGKEDNVVRIMTTHKSKGLQFNVVFLYLKDKLSLRDSLSAYHEKLGIGFQVVDELSRRNDFYHNLIEIETLRSSIEESMRVLYVATTRAKTQMHFVGVVQENFEYKPLDVITLWDKKMHITYVLNGLHTYNNLDTPKLFEIKKVTEFIEPHILETEKTESSIPKYNTMPMQPQTKFYSAHSQNKYEPLVLKNNTYQRGTKIHKMIELFQERNFESEKEYPIVKKLYESAFFIELLKQEHHFEYPFHIGIDNEIAQGYVDFIAFGKEITIVDFKSDFVESEEELVERYHQQLELYKRVFQKQFPEFMIDTYIYSTKLKKFIKMK